MQTTLTVVLFLISSLIVARAAISSLSEELLILQRSQLHERSYQQEAPSRSPELVQFERPRELLRRAAAELQANKLAEAETTARALLVKEPSSGEVHFLLGAILFRQGRAAESLAEYTEGARHHDPEARDLKMVALDYVLLNDYLNADKWLTKALE